MGNKLRADVFVWERRVIRLKGPFTPDEVTGIVLAQLQVSWKPDDIGYTDDKNEIVRSFVRKTPVNREVLGMVKWLKDQMECGPCPVCGAKPDCPHISECSAIPFLDAFCG